MKKKLIEFGFDVPTPQAMLARRDAFEGGPFDGCVFDIRIPSGGFAWNAWGGREWTLDEALPAMSALKQCGFRRFRHNFLRICTSPWTGGADDIIEANCHLAGYIASQLGLAGVVLDCEHYGEAKAWNYPRDGDPKGEGWLHVASCYRALGRCVMAALQSECPAIRVLMPLGYHQPWANSGYGYKPLCQTDYGLLAPFLDGMIAACSKGKIIDGCEAAYSFRGSALFRDLRRQVTKGIKGWAADPKRYAKAVSVAMPVWLDCTWGGREWNPENLAANYYPPEQFEATVRHALASSDELVWVYSERVDWWNPEAENAAPDDYRTALKRIKR